jgi:hypothetical protein
MGAAPDPSDDHGSASQGGFAMSYDSPDRHDAPSGPTMDQGSPQAARAANLLVGVTIALLLIALAVVVALG